MEKIDIDNFLQRILDRWRPRLARVNVQPFFSARTDHSTDQW